MPVSTWQIPLGNLLLPEGEQVRLSCSIGTLPLFLNFSWMVSFSAMAVTREIGHGPCP